jgi:hypothetical protein
MKQYMLSVIHGDDNAVPPGTDFNDVFEAVDKFNAKLAEAKAMVFAGGLVPASSATVVDGTGEGPLLTDGPYLESKEYLGGFWVIEAEDLDAAIAWAKEGSAACLHAVEVRPFEDGAPE